MWSSFKNCPIARMAWFGTHWGLNLDRLQVDSGLELVKLMVDPPISWSLVE